MSLDFSTAAEGIKDSDLDQITSLARIQIRLEKKLAHIEEELKQAKKNLRMIAEDELPNAMTAVGMETFELVDGSKISVKEKWTGRITDKNRHFVMNWLAETGHDGIISNEIKVLFDKGQEEDAAKLFKKLSGGGQMVSKNKTVNTATLKALCLELIRDGVDVPIAELGMFVIKKAIIK